MSTIFKVILFCFLGTSLFAENIEKLKEFHKHHEVKKHTTWSGWQDTPLVKRVVKAPANIVEYVGLDNKIYGFQGVPQSAEYEEGFYKDFLAAMNELPKEVKKQVEKYLIGVFFVNDLGSSGFSEHIYKNGEYYGGWILFDQGLLSNIKANDWATWRVNTAFKKSSNYKLDLIIEDEKDNNRKQAIQFILLHELAHVIGSSIKAHPKPHEWKNDPKKFDYSKISWNSFSESLHDLNFQKRKEFQLYRFDKAKLSVAESKELIEDLKKSDFPSLYGSNTFFEDFAEAYTIYVHTILMKKTYELILSKNSKEIISFKDPFNQNVMQKKRIYFDRLLK